MIAAGAQVHLDDDCQSDEEVAIKIYRAMRALELEPPGDWMELANARAARMSEAFREILDLCVAAPTEYVYSKELMELVGRIDAIAHRGLYGEKCPVCGASVGHEWNCSLDQRG